MNRALAVVVAAALLLTGCVGIPTSGGVATGPIIDDQSAPELIVLPSGPRAGALPEEILDDFMLAVRGPQNDYAIARQFLTSDLAATWDPDASATVRTGIASTTPGSGANSLDYTVTSTAVVDADGGYRETDAAAQTLEFDFVLEDGEWRISAAADGIVLSSSSFDVVFTERALYFFDPSYDYLVPDVRWYPSRATLPVRIVRALLAGPAPWLQQGVVLSAFPTAVSLTTAKIESGTATVEFSEEALAATPEDRNRMRQQLAASLDVGTVVMTVGGIELETPEVTVGAIKNPQVESAVLLGTGAEFGFDASGSIAPIPGISEAVVAGGGSAATLANNKQTVVFLSAGGVSVARVGKSEPLIVDSRAGLIRPSIDPFRFVWSVGRASAASLTTFELDGTQHPVQSTLPADASVSSIDVSRDGTRLLMYLTTPVGPRLIVAGIIRQQDTNIPTALGVIEELRTPGGAPIGATWIDDRTVATLSRDGGVTPVSVVAIGGPSDSLGQVTDGVSIVGGNNATDGVRLLRATGEVWRTQGSGWVSTGITASFLATKQ